MSELRLLLIEDNQDDAVLLERVLRRQGMAFSIRYTPDAESFRQAFGEEAWDTILSDFNLLGTDALEILAWVRERNPDIPFLVISGKVGEELAVAVMRAGANDFLVKGQLARLAPAIEREVKEAQIRRKHRLQERERLTLHMAIHQMADGVVITDPSGVIVYANPAMADISGYASSELTGRSPSVFKSGLHDRAFYKALWETLLRGNAWRGTLINRRKDGKLWYSETIIAPVLGPDGACVNYVSTNRDLTAQKGLEAQLAESHRLEALGILTAGVAHDFNNLLMPILVHAEMGLMRMTGATREASEFEAIVRQCERARVLIRQLVAYARPGNEPPEPVILRTFLKESLVLLKAAMPVSVRLELHIEEADGMVIAGATALQQVLLNLCTNAFHAMGTSVGILGISLRMSRQGPLACAMEQRLPAGDYLVLEIRDTGCGIPEDQLDKIFFPFFSTKARESGTGLGLSIVHGLVTEMGGGIQVDSVVGEGTRFRVYLPRFQGTGSAAEEESEAPISREELPSSILLVDDEVLLLTVMARALRTHGIRVRSMRSSEKAMRWFQDHPHEVEAAIVDYAMPDCSGLDLVASLKDLRPDLPCFILSGNLDALNQERARELGCAGLIQKPVPIQELLQTLAAHKRALSEP